MSEEVKKAQCPKCGKRILWDWCHDLYVYEDGEELRVVDYLGDYDAGGERVDKGDGVRVVFCTCDFPVGIVSIKDDSMFAYSHPDMGMIDWEENENSYDCGRYR